MKTTLNARYAPTYTVAPWSQPINLSINRQKIKSQFHLSSSGECIVNYQALSPKTSICGWMNILHTYRSRLHVECLPGTYPVSSKTTSSLPTCTYDYINDPHSIPDWSIFTSQRMLEVSFSGHLSKSCIGVAHSPHAVLATNDGSIITNSHPESICLR